MSEKTEKKSYKQTLNLPRTDFPMEAKLVQNEPVRLRRWGEMGLYDRLMEARDDAPRWVLHDGPPFANGDIHIGHLINKTLKDVVMRFRSMEGKQTPYIPGWDCHGLPIEHKIQQELGPKLREMSTVEVRRRCYAYAEKYAKLQSEQFQRLGILGDWEHPYWTMTPGYEAATLEVFARFVEAGLVYKQLKPVHWSIANRTALADAELEYRDRNDPSVFVLFSVVDRGQLPGSLGAGKVPAGTSIGLMIWTTTPWTLPANLAVAVHPEGVYQLVKLTSDGREDFAILGKQRVESVAQRRDASAEVLGECTGSELAGSVRYRHPFIERQSPVVVADYVTFEDGTGLVHTAPGHGEEDYNTGIQNGLEIYSPVLADGRFDESVPQWLRGMLVWDANPVIVQHLSESGVLYHELVINHSYPHDWRSKTPTIFRATEQWFVGIDRAYRAHGETDSAERSLRERAESVINDQVRFIPKWGQSRMASMVASRPDWCISRQRAWGLPIPVFYNEQGEALLTPQSVRAVARTFAEHGSDAWFTMTPAELLGDFDPGPAFPKDTLRKEKDIFDVWFESGSSWHAVLQERAGLKFPADLYLEGSDQHRGWFQLSLLPALGATGEAPFRQVLTHGFVVKPDGTKVSKSDKEYVTATQEIDRHGADLLRLWCCSVDYQHDIPVSPQVIREFGDKYRKIRNTLRFLLGNLSDFDPARDAREITGASLDGWAWSETDKLIADVRSAYDAYQLHRAFRLLHDFCSVQISAIYGNAMKDRLYCEAPDSPLRRRSQTVMHRIVAVLSKLLAPMLVFTADEAWEAIEHKPEGDDQLPSVHLALLPEVSARVFSDGERADWALLMELRDQALGQLDALKKEAGLNKALDAEVVYPHALRGRLAAFGADLEDLVGAGSYSFAPDGEGAAEVKVLDRRETYAACARSWKRRADVGEDPAYPDLSARDARVVKGQ